jgi:hypothetical protein
MMAFGFVEAVGILVWFGMEEEEQEEEDVDTVTVLGVASRLME